MNARSLLRDGFYVGAHLTGLSRLIARRYRGRGVIFALHSVVQDTAPYPDYSLRCSVDRLERTLSWLQQEGVEFVSLDEAIEQLAEPRSRPFAAFTLDDGYADNLTHALPVMARWGAPFTVFVTTGMVRREIDAWWFGLAELIRSEGAIELPGFGAPFDCSDHEKKKRTFRSIEEKVHNDFALLPQVREAIAARKIDCAALVDREALTERQLAELASHPLVTIGGHTTTHPNLAEASAAVVEREMTDNRRYLQALTGKPVFHFAYPFGHSNACGSREADICRRVGFRAAVTTRAGALFPEHAKHLYSLPRMHLAADDTASTLRCKLDGLPRAIHSRWGDPVARM